MLTKFLIVQPGGRAGCEALQTYLRDKSRVSMLGEEFNLSEKRYHNPQNWLAEIRRVYTYSHPGKKARGCALKANDPSTLNWIELRRQISLTVPDLRVIFLTRNSLSQYAASVAAMAKTSGQLPAKVDVDHLLGMFKLWEIASMKLRQIFQRHSSLHIRYEDLIHQPRRIVNSVFEFLGLGTEKEFRIHPELAMPAVEIIENLDEVRQALQNTPWNYLSKTSLDARR